MILLSQIRKLRELIKHYGHDMAVAQQQGFDLGDDLEKLKTLALFRLNHGITDAVTEYFEVVDDDAGFVAGVLALAGSVGELIGRCQNARPELASLVIKMAEDMKLKKMEQFGKASPNV